MTEGMEHLLQTYQRAGFNISKVPTVTNRPNPVSWGFRGGASRDDATNRVTVVYAILAGPDSMGRVLAQRWGYETGTGERILAPGLFPTPMRPAMFDSVREGSEW